MTNSGGRALFARVGLYGASTFVSALAALATIPVTVHYAGVAAWEDAAVGMSIGAIAATIVSLGWPITGIAEVARIDRAQRGTYYASSLSSRSLLLAPSLIAAVVIAFLIAPHSGMICALAAFTLALQGLNANWFFVGSGDPLGILVCDSLVRAGALCVAAATLVITTNVPMFFVIQLLGAISAVLLATRRVFLRTGVSPLSSMGLGRGLRATRGQVHGSLTSLVATLYQSMPLIVVAAVAPTATSTFAIADRLLKLANTAGQPVIQVIQGWIPAKPEELRVRIVRGCAAALLLGVLAGVALLSSAGLLAQILTGGKVTAPLTVMIPMSIVLASTLFSQCLGVASLVPLGAVKSVSRSATVGALVAFGGLVVLVNPLGAVGAAWSVAVSELLVVSYQLIALARRFRSTDRGLRGSSPC